MSASAPSTAPDSANALPKLGPVRSADRFVHLDVLRGVALLAILPVNIGFLGLTGLFDLHPGPNAETSDLASYFVVEIVFHNKALTLFSFLFGVGLALMLQKRGDSAAVHSLIRRRFLVLFVIGVLHATLFWYGDILTYYAPLGLVALACSSLSGASLLRLGAVLIVLPAGALCLLAGASALGQAQADAAIDLIISSPVEYTSTPPSIATWSQFWEGMALWSPSFETRVFQEGSFAQITAYRTSVWLWGFITWGLYVGWRIFGLFLIGMAWVRAGWFLSPSEHRLEFRGLMVWGLAVGAPFTAVSLGMSGLRPSTALLRCLAELCMYVGSLGLGAAAMGVIVLLFSRVPNSRVALWVSAVGRTALSNYLFQSAVCCLLFCSYGLGGFGTYSRLELLGITAGMWVWQILLSAWWLERFRFGPVEWLWRSLTYGRRQRFRSSA